MFKRIKRYWFQLMHPVIGEVWQLHRVTDDHSKQDILRAYEISPNRLASLIVEYKQKGYEFVSIAETAKRMGEKRRVNKFITITLDDGYADNYEIAYPIFKKYNVPFCIYVCEKMVTGESSEDNIEHYRMLTVEQLQILDKEPLCTIGSHSRSHVRLACLSKEMQLQEILHCKIWLESLLGHQIEDYSFPYGNYSAVTISLLSEIGVTRAVASWGGGVRRNTQECMYNIPRKLVTETDIQ